MSYLSLEKSFKFAGAFDTLVAMKEWGEEPMNFDSLSEASSLDEDSIALLLDSVGVAENHINAFLSRDESESLGETLKDALEDVTLDGLSSYAYDFATNYNFDEVDTDSGFLMDMATPPPHKAGYTRKLVVRDGKKVFINKRDPNKRVVLSPKQRQALMKARMKAHTGLAEMHRKKSVKKRINFKL